MKCILVEITQSFVDKFKYQQNKKSQTTTVLVFVLSDTGVVQG